MDCAVAVGTQIGHRDVEDAMLYLSSAFVLQIRGLVFWTSPRYTRAFWEALLLEYHRCLRVLFWRSAIYGEICGIENGIA